MESRKISDGVQSDLGSMLVSALDSAGSLDNIQTPAGMFGFNAVIDSGDVHITNNILDFEYTVPFDDDAVPNESEIVIYNLSRKTISALKKGNPLTITAGYGTDTGIILNGKISKVKTKREDVDVVTTVYVLDNAEYKDGVITEQAFTENTKASDILKWLLERLDLPVEIFKVQCDHTYDSTTTVSGSITENIKKYADVCGVSVYVSKQRIYCRPIWDGDNIHFTISPETGMIDSPQPFEESNTPEEYKDNVTGYEIDMLFQHRMNTAAIVDVKSKNYTGTYRVCSGEHVYDGLSATTHIKCIENIATEIVQTSKSSSGLSGNGVIEKAVNWAIGIANDDSHGYDQNSRWGPDYDCSSLVISAYRAAGPSLVGASYTGNMYEAFIKEGFEDVKSSCNLTTGVGLKKGDILLNNKHHTCIVIEDGGKRVNAGSNERGGVTGGRSGDQTGGEITIKEYSNYSSGWDHVLRYSKSSTWIKGHTATTYGMDDSDDNGICGWNGLNYHNISGCHVAIPTYCVKQSNLYNEAWANADYPELAEGYGVVLEVRSPDTGKTVRAVVADCGNFGKHNTYNHNTALDLPPNTYTALGLTPGTYKIEYRVVGKVSGWNGEQV